MSSYLSNILTNTTSKYNTLRQNLTSSEADGDTEDDSHIARVLRAYYTETHRQLPPWLPPDPKRSISSSNLTQSFTSSLRTPSSNSLAQGGGPQQKSGGLSELWDQPGQQRGAGPAQPMSLRRQAAERNAPSYRGQDTLAPTTSARPLPSQRAGSYQSVASQQQQQYSDPSPPQSAGSMSSVGSGSAGGGTAQERLKARLWGRGGSSTNLSTQAGGGGGGHGGQGNPYAARERFGGPAGPR